MSLATKTRILMSLPSTSHVEIAEDELNGLRHLGYTCDGFPFAARAGTQSKIGRLLIVLRHAVLLVVQAYRFKPDVIYFNSRLEQIAGTRDFLTILLIRLLYWKPVLFMIKSHGSDLEVLENSPFLMRNIILPFLKKQVNAWLFLSSEEKSKVLESGFTEASKIFVTKNIVRANQFKQDKLFRSAHQIPENRIILLFAGRFIREKGVFEVVESFISIAERFNVVLFLVGDGPEKENLENLIESATLKNKVIFTGFITEQEVIPYYSNADLLVFPTYFPEGFPMALFNAVAAGLSIVTTATRAAVDYLNAPDNCLWVEPKDSRSVANAIETLLNSPAQRQHMALHNLQKAELFSQEKVSIELSSIIESILLKRVKK